MRKTAVVLFSLFIFLAPVSPVFAWGEEGHKTVGRIAALRVKPRTTQKIAEILRPDESLAGVSTWADWVKERIGNNDQDPDTNAFLQDRAHNERNREWHYVNLPLGCTRYDNCIAFHRADDIVHMINVCIRTLRGNPDPNHPLSKRNALKLLVHFIGDLHQPLHVGSGYINRNGPTLATNAEVIRQRILASDRGGNELIIDGDRQRLHSYWDFELVRMLMTKTGSRTSDELATFLRGAVTPQPNWNTSGPLNTWGARWATDSLNQSRANSYRGVRITRSRSIPVLRDGRPVIVNGQPSTETVYDIVRPNNYDVTNREVVRVQLAKAGFRLAKLLDAIFAE